MTRRRGKLSWSRWEFKKRHRRQTDLEFRVEEREVSGFQPEQIAQLPVQAQNRFERDSVAELVKDIRGQSRIRRGHSGDTATAAGIHLGLVFLFSSFVLMISLGRMWLHSLCKKKRKPINEKRFVNNNEQLTISDSLLVTQMCRGGPRARGLHNGIIVSSKKFRASSMPSRKISDLIWARSRFLLILSERHT